MVCIRVALPFCVFPSERFTSPPVTTGDSVLSDGTRIIFTQVSQMVVFGIEDALLTVLLIRVGGESHQGDR